MMEQGVKRKNLPKRPLVPRKPKLGGGGADEDGADSEDKDDENEDAGFE